MSVSDVLTELQHLPGSGSSTRATLEPHAGFTVVTGETGAGKTMIVDRARPGHRGSGRRRPGADRRGPRGRRGPDPRRPGRSGGGTCVRGRRGRRAGRRRHRDRGAHGRRRRPVPGPHRRPIAHRCRALAELTDELVAMHGQSEAISLLRPARTAGRAGPLRRARASRSRPTGSSARLAAAGRGARRPHRARARAGTARAGAAPRPGRDRSGGAAAGRGRRADRHGPPAGERRRAAGRRAEAVAALSGADTLADEPTAVGLVEAAAAAARRLRRPAAGRLGRDAAPGAAAVLGDVAADLAGYLDALDADPARLERRSWPGRRSCAG